MAVHLPFLPAERLIRAGIAPPDTHFAVIEKKRGALRIAALSPGMLVLGLTPGMALADARAQVPGLAAFGQNSEADRALLLRLADSCERYTPMVAVAGDAALVLDLTGCFDVLGMEEAGIADDLARRLAQYGLHAGIACAATPDAALGLARFGKEAVESLPIAVLDLGEETCLALRRAGLHTLGDLKGRPRAPLAARFGTELPVRLARLLEEEDRRITPRRMPSTVRAEQRFAEPLTTVAPLLGVIQRLAGKVEHVLAGRGEGGRRFEVTLFRADGHVARLAVDSGMPLRAPAVIERLFEERLESLSDPLDPGFGYDMVRLTVPVTETLDEEQADLAEPVRTAADLTPLLDRLMVRFGAESVRGFRPQDAHLPEYAMALVPPEEGRFAWPSPETEEPPLRPVFLFDPPQYVTVLAEVPDGPPRRFTWRGHPYRVVRHEGPERISYPWWKHPDGDGPTRDYYRVEDESGHRFWLFRHGLYGHEKADPRWYLHGLFA